MSSLAPAGYVKASRKCHSKSMLGYFLLTFWCRSTHCKRLWDLLQQQPLQFVSVLTFLRRSSLRSECPQLVCLFSLSLSASSHPNLKPQIVYVREKKISFDRPLPSPVRGCFILGCGGGNPTKNAGHRGVRFSTLNVHGSR